MSAPKTNDPNFAIMVSRLGASGQWDRVWDSTREWLAAEPENLAAHRAAGQAAVHLKRYEEAQPHITRVLEGRPFDDFAHRLLSIVQFHAGQHTAADESVRRAIDLNPHDAYHWYHLGWMCYQQKSFPSARGCLQKARELAPNDPNIINLLALCESDLPDAPARQKRQYEQALELDPENADVHNNLGVYYLNVEHNAAAAEDCFRRALSLNPSSTLARQNLFIALKKRDTLFRLLHLPRDLMFRFFGFFGRSRRKSVLLYLLVFPLWIITARFWIAGITLWFFFVWPLVKVYEKLTIGDIKAQAGEIGARKGGIFGYRAWSVKTRLGIFAGVLFAFWGGTAYCIWRWTDGGAAVFGLGVVITVIALLLSSLYRLMKSSLPSGRNAREKGGLFGYRGWSTMKRLGVFAGLLAVFWGAAGYCLWRWPGKANSIISAFVLIMIAGILAALVITGLKKRRLEAQRRQRTLVVGQLLPAPPVKKTWWSFLRRKSPLNE